MARYMKKSLPISRYSNTGKTPIIKRHHSNTYSPRSKDFQIIIRELWDLPEREFQAAALDIMQKI